MGSFCLYYFCLLFIFNYTANYLNYCVKRLQLGILLTVAFWFFANINLNPILRKKSKKPSRRYSFEHEL